jgi:hypothetical protein
MWPTPRAGKTTSENPETWEVRQKAGKVSTPPLAMAAQMWPTPSSQESLPTEEMVQEMRDNLGKPHERLYLPNRKHHSQTTLARAVHLWPTLTCRDSSDTYRQDGPGHTSIEHGVKKSRLCATVKRWPTPKGHPSGPDYARAARPGSGGDDLATAAARYPTPSAGDAKLRGEQSAKARGRLGGSLNPPWVEWLMGFPTGWTASKPLATPWFLRWWQEHGRL